MTELLNTATLDARIRHVYAQLSAAERKLADVVLARQRELLGYSATELALLAGTSKSSAARFFRSLGYESYESFRHSLRDSQQQSPLARMGRARSKTSVVQQFKTHLMDDAERLREWSESLPDAQLEAALALLTKARKVWVVGYRHSHLTAFYAHSLLAQVRGEVLSLNDAVGREADLLACASEKDVVLAVDFRRRSQRLPSVLAAARTAGAQVLVLTDAPVSALAMQSNVVLRCGAAEQQGLFDSYVCAVSLVNFLATSVAQQLRSGTQERLSRIERMHVALDDLHPQL